MRGDRTPARRAFVRAGICLFLSAFLGQCSHREPAEEAPSRTQPAKVVLGYYPASRKVEFGLSSLKFEFLTHIAHAFTKPDSAGNLVVEPDYLYPELLAEAHRRGVKVLMSVGGWGNCEGFPGMAALPTTRGRFIGQVRDFLKTNGYDGVDIDWEYVSNEAQQRDFVSFIKELSQALKAEEPPLLLTMAAPAGDYWARWLDFETLAGSFDFIGFMTYDFHGPWTDHSGHNSPLYLCGGDGCGSLDSTFAYGLSRQVPKEKLLVGLAFYGRSFDCPELYQPYKQSLDTTYAEVATLLSGGWTRSWDDCARVPVARRSDQKVIISYDDEQSVEAKCRYVLEKNAAGVIIWELTQDTVNGRPVLLNVVGNAFSNKK